MRNRRFVIDTIWFVTPRRTPAKLRQAVWRCAKSTQLSQSSGWVSLRIVWKLGGRLAIDRPALALMIGLPLVAGLVLGANQTRAGAFMPWLGSIGYWIAISCATWWLIAAATWIVDHVLGPWHPPHWLVWVVGAVAGSISARPVIYAVTDLFRPIMREPVLRGMRPWSFDLGFLGYYLTNWSLVIAMWVIACLLAARWRDSDRTHAVDTDVGTGSIPAPAAAHGMVLRLPPPIGRNVIALQAEDHYVRVHTDLGNALVLGSLSDAIRDVVNSGITGQRTHRSWWVASAAVVAHAREGRHLVLKLSNGLSAPVSVTYREMATASGFL